MNELKLAKLLFSFTFTTAAFCWLYYYHNESSPVLITTRPEYVVVSYSGTIHLEDGTSAMKLSHKYNNLMATTTAHGLTLYKSLKSQPNLIHKTGSVSVAGPANTSHNRTRTSTTSTKNPVPVFVTESGTDIGRKQSKNSIDYKNNNIPPPNPGYIITERYREQLTSASRNLQSLQCWSAYDNTDMLVVEPLAVSSALHTPFQDTPSTALKFSDLYDLEAWNTESSRLGYSRLVSHKIFLKQAPRKVITVQLKDFGVKSNDGTTKWKLCSPSKKWPYQQERTFLKEHNFLIVRAVCVQFISGQYLTMDEFQTLIFGSLIPNEVTVFFEEWRGIGIGNKIPVRNSGCANSGIQERVPLSSKVREDANKYIRHHFNSDYVAIMARLEKSRLSSYRRDLTPHCLEQLVKHWRTVTQELGINQTFLSIDVGRYGSHTLKNTFNKRTESSSIEEQLQILFEEIYGNSLTVQMWENSFKGFATSMDKGYIAQMQKQVAVQAKSVVFMGGGCFQKHAMRLYQFSHPRDDWCINIVAECTQNEELPRVYINNTQLVLTSGTVF